MPDPNWLIVLAIILALLVTIIVLAVKAGRNNATSNVASPMGDEAHLEAQRLREEIARLETVKLERDNLAAQLQDTQSENKELVAKNAAQDAQMKAQVTHHAEQLKILQDAKEQLKAEFQSLSNTTLKSQSEEFAKVNKDRVEQLLIPLKTKIAEFEGLFQSDNKTRVADTAVLKELINTLSENSVGISNEAKKLTEALRGSSKVQGDWGELVLKNILEKVGLVEGREFHTQSSTQDDEGNRKRPDVLIELPNNQRLVIDSKVSLKAFQECLEAEDEELRSSKLKLHIASVRGHIDSLATQDYASLYSGVDFTVMFIPIEGAFAMAIQNDPGAKTGNDLMSYAISKGVALATPSTLLMTMRTVENLWRIEKQNRNAQLIADRAGRLYDKFVGFVSNMEKVGLGIDNAKKTYVQAFGQLKDGPGNLVSQTEKLKELGANAKKQLPESIDNSNETPRLSDEQSDGT